MHMPCRLDDVEKSYKRSAQKVNHKRGERKEVGQRVGQRIKHNNRKRQCLEVLLVFNFLINADEHIEVGIGRGLQKQAIQKSLPTHFSCRTNLVTGDMGTKPSWQIVIEENFQSASRSLSKSLLAKSRTASACSRSTPSKSSRNCSRVSPAAR